MADNESSTPKSASVPEASLSAASLEPVPLDLSIPEVLDRMVFRGPPVIINRSYNNSGFHKSPEIMAALEARASGNPKAWQPSEPPAIGAAWQYRARARRWMRHTGLPAPDLLKIARERQAKDQAAKGQADPIDEKYDAALTQMNYLVRTGQFYATGRPSDTRKVVDYRPREHIGHDLIDELRTIDPWGFFRSSREPDPGPFYHDVRIGIAEVDRLFPVGSEAAPVVASQGAGEAPVPEVVPSQESQEKPAREEEAIDTVKKRKAKEKRVVRKAREVAQWYRDHLLDLGLDPDDQAAKPPGLRSDRSALVNVLAPERPNGWLKALESTRSVVWGDRVRKPRR